MSSHAPSYHGYRFPSEIISHAVWLYYRFALSFRDVEDLLAQRGITVTYETIRQWCLTFGRDYARTLRQRRGRQGDTWHLDELFVTLNGRQQYLWRAVDEDGDVLDILVQSRRNRRAAVRFFRKLLKRQGCVPRRLITDKLRSYPAACRRVMPSVVHHSDQFANNRAEVSHQATQQRERQMRRFKSADPKEIQHESVYREKPLRVHGGFEPTHLSLTLSRRLMRDLRAVVLVLLRAVHHGRHHGTVSRGVASQFVRDQTVGRPTLSFQHFAKEAHGCLAIAARLDQDVEEVAVLVHGPP